MQNETQTQSARENRVKESTKQAQIMETIGRKEENMKQVVGTTSQKKNSNNKNEYDIIEERK